MILAGISAGNYLGGRVADRYPSPSTLGLILLAGGASSLSVLYLLGVSADVFESFEIRLRIIFLTAALFFLPSLILGMVSPVVIKLRLQDLDHAGNVVGKIYAVSTVGSIFGTFITGFFLIQWIGSRETILLVAIVLVAMSLVLGNIWQVRASFPLVGVFLLLGSLSFATGQLDSDCTRESNYYCIHVTDTLEGDPQRVVRVLELDNLLHSYVDPLDPTFLVYGYEQVTADVATYVSEREPSPRILFIGGGGYTMPRFVETLYPENTLEVIEIDPEVTNVAFDYLELRADTQIVTYNEDARIEIPKLPGGEYDMVVGDAFHDVSIPFHLTTREFNEQVRALLKDDGIYIINVIDELRSGKFLRSYVHTLQRTFSHVYVVSDEPVFNDDTARPYVVVASSQPLTLADLEQANEEAGRGSPAAHFMPEDELTSWLNSGGKVLLTDNHAPVDNLMAPVFLARADKAIAAEDQYYNAGTENLSRGKFEQATEDLSQAIRLNPRNSAYFNARGVAYDSLGQFESAIEDFDQAILLDPTDSVTYYNRGATYRRLGQFEQAIEDQTESIALNPQDPDPHVNRGLAYIALGEDERSREDFDAALQLGYDTDVLQQEIDEVTNGS